MCFDRPMDRRAANIHPADERPLRAIGADLLRARRRRAWSQRDLQAVSGVHQSEISRAERGLAPGMRITAVASLILALEAEITLKPRSRTNEG
jgi:transcriptional regulator with XRE-family HTH domain